MSWSSTWTQLRVLIFLLLKCGVSESMIVMEEPPTSKIIVPTSHVALSGDVTIFILQPPPIKYFVSSVNTKTTTLKDGESATKDEIRPKDDEREVRDPLVLRVSLLDGLTAELVGEILLESQPNDGGNVSVIIPCGFFARGGTYMLELQYKSSTMTTNTTELPEIQISSALEVKWPIPSLAFEPPHFNTYPNQPISASVKYNGIACIPAKNIPLTEYILQVIYCGSSVVSCDPQNKSRVQVLYYREIKGFPTEKLIFPLRCELFGLAGNYALRIKPTETNPTAPTTSVYLKVDLSDKYAFNVHARSVYPCEGTGGVSVLFEYPSCRLQGDRVRVYGRLRADVASLAPPSSLHYVAEIKAPPGKHSLTFECDIFTEKFIEYCFVYVNQVITGAMSEVKLACIPTFPLQESDAGGWGPWSPWTPCSTSCVGGTRNRYRFCDTPPPRYGARFCQGKAVETATCGGSSEVDVRGSWNKADWECHHGKELAATRPEVTAEVGVKCRCGCVINFREDLPRKILAASTQACPGRSFWLLQASSNSVVKLHLDQAQFPCPGQYFRARDGDSLSANLLTDIAFGRTHPPAVTIVSSDQSLLLEFFSDEVVAAGESCIGGFLAHAAMLQKPALENETILAIPYVPSSATTAVEWIYWLTPAHLAAAILLAFIFFISVFLALQYAYRYRKYQIAEDLDNLSLNSEFSETMHGMARRSRAQSSTTLISEVVSLVRLSRGTPRHAKLKTSPCDLEDGYESTETQAEYEDESSIHSGIMKSKDAEESGSQKTITPSRVDSVEDNSSLSSVVLIGQPEVKYARPVKLRTLESTSVINPTDRKGGNELHDTTNASTDEIAEKVHQYKSANTLEGFPTAGTKSSVPAFRGGKETKDRRNRERLLQGHGSSEFNINNSEMDLELDYYDYNVANASAVPGSYLGMDPAFLVWIPPLLSGDMDILPTDEENHELTSNASNLEPRLSLNIEGASLTPSEFRRMRASRIERLNSAKQSEDGCVKKSDSSETSSDETSESRTKLCERLLPIHRILEDSRIRVSDESLCGHIFKDKPTPPTVIPNRLHDTTPTPDAEAKVEATFSEKGKNRLEEDHRQQTTSTSPKPSPQLSRRGNTNSVNSAIKVVDKGEKIKVFSSSKKSFPETAQWRMKHQQNERELKGLAQEEKGKRDNGQGASAKLSDSAANLREQSDADRTYEEKPKETRANVDFINIHTKYRDLANLNVISETKNLTENVGIPMMELSGTLSRSPAKVHKSQDNKIVNIVKAQVQSPDYGVESDIKDESVASFYDLICESEDRIKFADDDDEYIDNKMNV